MTSEERLDSWIRSRVVALVETAPVPPSLDELAAGSRRRIAKQLGMGVSARRWMILATLALASVLVVAAVAVVHSSHQASTSGRHLKTPSHRPPSTLVAFAEMNASADGDAFPAAPVMWVSSSFGVVSKQTDLLVGLQSVRQSRTAYVLRLSGRFDLGSGYSSVLWMAWIPGDGFTSAFPSNDPNEFALSRLGTVRSFRLTPPAHLQRVIEITSMFPAVYDELKAVLVGTWDPSMPSIRAADLAPLGPPAFTNAHPTSKLVGLAEVPATHTWHAYVQFAASLLASPLQQNRFQDGNNDVIFHWGKGGPSSAQYVVGGNGWCTELSSLPTSVLLAWKLPIADPSCPSRS
ncbi:MAG: hypothetical protein ABSD78_08570 [Acidimicrobiales bacterium]